KVLFFDLLAIILILAIWQLLAVFFTRIRPIPFPTPVDVFWRLGELFSGELLYDKSIGEHVMMSLSRWAVAYCITVITGLWIGMVLGSYRLMHAICMPAIYVLQLIPGLAWIPIALLLFGIGEKTTVFMIFITALPPVIINTTGGIRSVPKIYTNVAQMIGLRKGETFFRVLLPASLLSIINGLRIGFANGWRVLIAAEMIVGVSVGLGYSLIQARWSLDFEAALVCIVIICIIGLFIEKIVFGVIEKKVLGYQGI
ncbi:MAG: ABC transporter permease subunit, partial [Deltaproteobacteria bacterium]|nr:ABC transporter permease subunit [Deltaproteobacteria bacterium]